MSAGAVIVGASHAGVQAAVSMRQAGWQEPIHLVSAEDELPYHRPPLSKAFLLGEKSADQIQLRAESFYAGQGIELHLGTRALGVDAAGRKVLTTRGELAFDKLILATGARARRLPLPGADLDGVFTLRDMADARRLKPAMDSAESLTVIGGGFIGLEVAATAAKNGKAVTVIEMLPRLLTRSVPEIVAAHLAGYHAAKGATILFGKQIEAIEGEGGRVRAVRLGDDARIEADLVLVGIGGVADLSLAEPLGLATAAGGILVDEHGMTSIPGIYAVGDCAAFDNPYAGGVLRLESVQNAVDQAKAAGTHAAGMAAPLSAVPWFWTDQYDLKVQMAGIAPADGEQVLRGDPESHAYSVFHLRDRRLVAAFSVNRAADHMAARRLIATGAPLDLALAADPAVPLLRAAPEPQLRSAAQ